MVRVILTVIFFLFLQSNLFSSTFDELKKNKKTSYLDFILLKIENRLIQRHGLLGAQPVTLRVQYQNVGSQVNFIEDQSKIVVSIVGVMDKRRYTEKKYKPKISDCNVLRNILSQLITSIINFFLLIIGIKPILFSIKIFFSSLLLYLFS